MPTLFFRLLGHADKAAALTEALAAVRQGCTRDAVVHAVDPASFSQVPGSPFAYWVSERIRRLFAELPPFESEGRTVRQGLATADDFRFVRAWWEVAPERLLDGVNEPNWREDLAAFQAWCRQRTCEGKRWVLFAKGGAYSPYYSDLHLVVDWERNGEEIRGFDRAFIRNENFYFRSGLTWPRRTQLGFNLRAHPAGAIFADKGPVAFISRGDVASYLALANSRAFGVVISLHMAFGSYEVGVVQRSPVADCNGHGGKQLDALARSAVVLKQTLDTANETSHVFCVPAVLLVSGEKLAEGTAAWQARIAEVELRLAEYQHAIDDIAFSLYGIDGQDRQAIEEAANSQPAVISQDEDEMDNPEDDTDTHSLGTAHSSLVADLFSYAVGCTLGRWDVRCTLQERSVPDLPDPFAPLPVCSPGMLTGEDGLPLRQAPPGYPLRIAADGIIVDDPDHPDDLVRCVREGLDLVLAPSSMVPGGAKHNGQSTMDWEQEACEILGVRELREYFHKPGKGGFWDDHIKRYSKSRRKAPIYWLLQSSRKNYALWLSYHRLDKDMLFKALMHYVEPKIRLEASRLDTLRAQRVDVGTSGSVAKKLARDIDRQEALLSELRDFEDKLRRVANLHLDPDLNDGVVLNIAPLRELVPWKEAKSYWDELLAGKYEWSSIGKQLREKGIVHGH